MRETPESIAALAKDLGISRAHLRALTEKHGEDLLEVLQEQWRRKVPERPRLLHRDSTRGYTAERALALHDEPEAVDALSQRRITAEAHADDLTRRQADLERRRKLAPERRLALARREAKARRIDVSAKERVIERQITAIERALDPPAAA